MLNKTNTIHIPRGSIEKHSCVWLPRPNNLHLKETLTSYRVRVSREFTTVSPVGRFLSVGQDLQPCSASLQCTLLGAWTCGVTNLNCPCMHAGCTYHVGALLYKHHWN